jgi:putative hemolysin
VDGALPVRELNSDWGLALPESADYVTVAGLVLSGLGAVPRGGERLVVAGRAIHVTEMQGHRVARVSVSRSPVATPRPPEG